jgi:hypothetical protein
MENRLPLDQAVGLSVGEEITHAMQKAGVELARHRLCGWKFEGQLPGRMTLPAATVQQKGYLLHGCLEGQALNLDYVKVCRFSLHPAKIAFNDDGDGRVINDPSIIISHRLVMACETPGCFEQTMWWCDIMEKSDKLVRAKLHGVTDPELRESVRATYRRKLICHKCGKLVSVKRNLFNGKVFDDGTPGCDSMYRAQDEDNPDLLQFVEASETSEVIDLPRIWVVYRASAAPMPWTPRDDDNVAAALENRVNQDGNTIRPYGLARQSGMFHRAAYVTTLVDVPVNGTLRCGWIPDELLQENWHNGYHQKFAVPPSPRKQFRDYQV